MRTITNLRLGYVAWLLATSLTAGIIGAVRESNSYVDGDPNPAAAFFGWLALWVIITVPATLAMVALDRIARNQGDIHAALRGAVSDEPAAQRESVG